MRSASAGVPSAPGMFGLAVRHDAIDANPVRELSRSRKKCRRGGRHSTRGRLRDVVQGTPWEGLHPHAFWHLVATQLDRAGLSAREIADYLGHERVSMTQDVDMSRGTNEIAAAAALNRLAPPQ